MSEFDRFLKDNMYPYSYVDGLDCDSIIIELGTYTGNTAKLLANMYKQATVHTFEPVLSFYNEAIASCKENSNVNCYPFGLGTGNYEFTMYLQGEATSMIKQQPINLPIQKTFGFKVASPAKQTVSLPTITCQMQDFFEFLRENQISKIDLLYINIEGAEYDLLTYIFSKNFQTQIKHLVVKFHYPSSENNKKISNIFDILSKTHKVDYDYKYMFTRWTRLI